MIKAPTQAAISMHLVELPKFFFDFYMLPHHDPPSYTALNKGSRKRKEFSQRKKIKKTKLDFLPRAWVQHRSHPVAYSRVWIINEWKWRLWWRLFEREVENSHLPRVDSQEIFVSIRPFVRLSLCSFLIPLILYPFGEVEPNQQLTVQRLPPRSFFRPFQQLPHSSHPVQCSPVPNPRPNTSNKSISCSHLQACRYPPTGRTTHQTKEITGYFESQW